MHLGVDSCWLSICYLSPHGCTNFIGNEENRPQERLESILPSENSNLISSSTEVLSHRNTTFSTKTFQEDDVKHRGTGTGADDLGRTVPGRRAIRLQEVLEKMDEILRQLMEEILRQLRLVVYPIFYRVLYIPGG